MGSLFTFIYCLIGGCLLLNPSSANASLYEFNGTFANGAGLGGTMDIDNGFLTSIDLHGGGSLPGDRATNWVGNPQYDEFCTGTCAPVAKDAIGTYASSFYMGSFRVSETYLAASQTYSLFFNGGGSAAYLDLDFTLAAGGLILGGKAWDALMRRLDRLSTGNGTHRRDGVGGNTVA